MGRALGIDLGTTRCMMSVWEGGRLRVVPNALGFRATPSVVAYLEGGRRLVGEPARQQAVLNPQATVVFVKRFLGRRSGEVDANLGIASCPVLQGPNASIRFAVPGQLVSPEEIIAALLRKMVDDAVLALGEGVQETVITVPANFNPVQRQAVMAAAELAGLEVLRLLNEPTAVALAYGMNVNGNGTILVFDLGGGTFDVAILDVGEGVCEVRAISGDSQLGGIDFDQRLVAWITDTFEQHHGVNLRSDPHSRPRLWDAAEQARWELSANLETEIRLASIGASDSVPQHLAQTLTRAQLEELTGDLVQRCREALQQVLAEARVSAREIDEVILVGGSTRMPAIREMVASFWGKPFNGVVDPQEGVSLGAALQAAMIKGLAANVVLLDATPFSLSVATPGAEFTRIIEGNTTIPCRREEIFTTAVRRRKASPESRSFLMSMSMVSSR
jgi:molecular chaperone DnaK